LESFTNSHFPFCYCGFNDLTDAATAAQTNYQSQRVCFQHHIAARQSSSLTQVSKHFQWAGLLKQCLEGRQFHNNEDGGRAICERFLMQEPSFYHNAIFKYMPRLDKCVSVVGDYDEK
jgi:hypothetical protein